MAFVEFDHVTKIYQMGENRVAAADGVTFTIEQGEFVVIVGPSGAGKTTILNILGGIDTPTSGSICLDGERISEYNNRQLTQYAGMMWGLFFSFIIWYKT